MNIEKKKKETENKYLEERICSVSKNAFVNRGISALEWAKHCPSLRSFHVNWLLGQKWEEGGNECGTQRRG